MTSQTLSPEDTNSRLMIEGETTDLTRYNAAPKPSPLPRPEAETAVLTLPDMPPRLGVFLPDFAPDTDSSPRPYPAPVPAGPTPRAGELLMPLLRTRTELYSASRARRGLPELARPVRYQGKHRAGGAR